MKIRRTMTKGWTNALERSAEKQRRGRAVAGLDLSLTGSAICWAPAGWDGDIARLRVETFGYSVTRDASPREHVERYEHIANGISTFLIHHKVSGIYVEDHAFGLGGAGAAKTRELHGAVKLALWRCFEIPVVPVNISTGRKTLLQKCPQKGAKQFTEDNVRRLKGEALYWDADQVDAFVVMNHGVMLEGGTPLSFPGVR